MRKKVKVVLSKNVPGLGSELDVVDVAIGYFRNHLEPNGLAEIATDQVLKNLETRKVKIEEIRQVRVKAAEEKTEKVKELKLSFKMKTDDAGTPFGSVTAKDIHAELEDNGVVDIKVLLDRPLKKLGEHKVELDFGDGVKGVVMVVLTKGE